MARKSPQITIHEIPGDHFPDLEAAQRAARANIASDLANLVRQMLDAGTLEVKDGLIIPRET
ncbi:hypothetical protein FBQ81_14315 [Chloroflexi bacterium CFX6]|nr:hypothetical protein [Chloroflexi bacterium CFX6]